MKDMIIKTLLGMSNMLPGLAMSVPDLAQGLIAQSGVPPMFAQMLAAPITKMYGSFLNSMTGTSETDIRMSDLLGAYTEHAVQQRVRERKASREYGKLDDTTITRRVDQTISSTLEQIYGKDHADKYKDDFGYKLLAGALEAGRGSSKDLAEDILGSLASNRIRIGSLGGLTLGDQGGYDKDKAQFATRILNNVDKWFFGDTKGHITGSLSSEEVKQAIIEAGRNGAFNYTDAAKTEAAIETHLKSVAQSMDNLKAVFGGNLTLPQAKQMLSGLYGFDMSEVSADGFRAVTQDLRALSGYSNISATDIFGDEKQGITGTASIIAQLAKGTGITQHRAASLASQLAVQTKGQSSGLWGVGTAQLQQMAGTRLLQDEISGANQNMAIALIAWAEQKGLDPLKLSAKDKQDFLTNIKGLDLRNASAVAEHVGGTARYNVLSNAELTQAVSAANGELSLLESRQREQSIRNQAMNDLRASLGDDILTALGGDKFIESLATRSLVDVQQDIMTNKKLTDAQKDTAINSLNVARDVLQYNNIVWKQRQQGQSPDTTVPAINIGYAAGSDGVLQYMNDVTQGKVKFDKEALFRVFLGRGMNYELTAADRKAAEQGTAPYIQKQTDKPSSKESTPANPVSSASTATATKSGGASPLAVTGTLVATLGALASKIGELIEELSKQRHTEAQRSSQGREGGV